MRLYPHAPVTFRHTVAFAVLIVVAALVGCGWGWLTTGGLLSIAARIGEGR